MEHETVREPVRETSAPEAKVYLQILFLLFLLSTTAYFLDLMNLTTVMKAILFTAIALMKAGLIAGYFMHLRFERITLVYVIVTPLILLVGLVAAVMPDGRSVLMSRIGF